MHTQSSRVFQAILNRTKETGDLPWWLASTIKVVSRQHVANAVEDHMGGSLFADQGWILLQPSIFAYWMESMLNLSLVVSSLFQVCEHSTFQVARSLSTCVLKSQQ